MLVSGVLYFSKAPELGGSRISGSFLLRILYSFQFSGFGTQLKNRRVDCEVVEVFLGGFCGDQAWALSALGKVP